MTNRDTFTSSQPGCLLVHFLALIFLAETSRTVLKRNGCLHFMYFYSTSILPKTQEEQNPYKILEQNPARFFFLSWWFLPTFLFSSSFFFFFFFEPGVVVGMTGQATPDLPGLHCTRPSSWCLCGFRHEMGAWWRHHCKWVCRQAGSECCLHSSRGKRSVLWLHAGRGSKRVRNTHNDGSGGNQSPLTMC